MTEKNIFVITGQEYWDAEQNCRSPATCIAGAWAGEQVEIIWNIQSTPHPTLKDAEQLSRAPGNPNRIIRGGSGYCWIPDRDEITNYEVF